MGNSTKNLYSILTDSPRFHPRYVTFNCVNGRWAQLCPAEQQSEPPPYPPATFSTYWTLYLQGKEGKRL